MWVIHKFLAYGNMAGCTTKGFFACPICGRNTYSMYLKCSRKCVYMGHRRYLPINHKYRSQKGPFNGKSEHLITPTIVQVSYIFTEIEAREDTWGKSESTKRKRNLKKVKIQRLTCGRKCQFYSIYHIGRCVHTLT